VCGSAAFACSCPRANRWSNFRGGDVYPLPLAGRRVRGLDPGARPPGRGRRSRRRAGGDATAGPTAGAGHRPGIRGRAIRVDGPPEPLQAAEPAGRIRRSRRSGVAGSGSRCTTGWSRAGAGRTDRGGCDVVALRAADDCSRRWRRVDLGDTGTGARDEPAARPDVTLARLRARCGRGGSFRQRCSSARPASPIWRCPGGSAKAGPSCRWATCSPGDARARGGRGARPPRWPRARRSTSFSRCSGSVRRWTALRRRRPRRAAPAWSRSTKSVRWATRWMAWWRSAVSALEWGGARERGTEPTRSSRSCRRSGRSPPERTSRSGCGHRERDRRDRDALNLPDRRDVSRAAERARRVRGRRAGDDGGQEPVGERDPAPRRASQQEVGHAAHELAAAAAALNAIADRAASLPTTPRNAAGGGEREAMRTVASTVRGVEQVAHP